MSSLLFVFVVSLCSDLLTCFVGSFSHWTAVYAWSTNTEHLWHTQDEQIWQPWTHMQVCKCTLMHCIHPLTHTHTVQKQIIHNYLSPDPTEVASTWGGQLLLQALASPPVTAVDQDCSAQDWRSTMQLPMKLDSIAAPTETLKLKMARLQ